MTQILIENDPRDTLLYDRNYQKITHLGQDIAHTLNSLFVNPQKGEKKGEREASLSGLDYLVKYAWQAEFLVIAGSGGRSSRASLCSHTVYVCAQEKPVRG